MNLSFDLIQCILFSFGHQIDPIMLFNCCLINKQWNYCVLNTKLIIDKTFTSYEKACNFSNLKWKISCDFRNADIINVSALLLAVCSNRIDAVKFLLNYGVDVDACDINGKKAIDIAIKENYVEIIKLFEEHSSKVL
jgi:ankyrin repeat protein